MLMTSSQPLSSQLLELISRLPPCSPFSFFFFFFFFSVPDFDFYNALFTTQKKRICNHTTIFSFFFFKPHHVFSYLLFFFFFFFVLFPQIKSIQIGDKKVKLQIWDTAGQERFKTITTAYYRGAMGIILAYDVTNRTTFNNVQNWMRQIEMHAAE
jgi:hypothetical protein